MFFFWEDYSRVEFDQMRGAAREVYHERSQRVWTNQGILNNNNRKEYEQ